MSEQEYLKKEIPLLIAKFKIQDIQSQTFGSHKTTYNLIRTQRFLAQTALIFVFQFLIIINFNFSYPALPIYLPLGIAFVFFYLLGNNAVWGLLLAGCTAYWLKGLAIDTAALYLIADILPSYLGATLSWRIFSFDIKPFAQYHECIKFLTINATTTCFIASVLKLIPLIIYYKNEMVFLSWDNKFFLKLMFNFIDLWIADVNAILILSSFVFSWAYISFSREQISGDRVSKFILTAVIIFILCSVIFMPYVEFIFVIVLAMIAMLIISLYYDYLMATTLLFIISSIYFTFFIVHSQTFILDFGLGLYTLVSLYLLFYSLVLLYLGHKK